MWCGFGGRIGREQMIHQQISDNWVPIRKAEKKILQTNKKWGIRRRACTGKPAFCAGELRSPVRNRENVLKMGMNHLKWYSQGNWFAVSQRKWASWNDYNKGFDIINVFSLCGSPCTSSFQSWWKVGRNYIIPDTPYGTWHKVTSPLELIIFRKFF